MGRRTADRRDREQIAVPSSGAPLAFLPLVKDTAARIRYD
jgi:hypothetical protein